MLWFRQSAQNELATGLFWLAVVAGGGRAVPCRALMEANEDRSAQQQRRAKSIGDASSECCRQLLFIGCSSAWQWSVAQNEANHFWV